MTDGTSTTPAAGNAADARWPARLGRRHVYIFPSAAGRLLLLVLAVMLLGSINYNNSLGYALTFLLGSLFMVAMLHTYRTLAGLRFGGGKAAPVFAGEEATFLLSLDNRDGPRRCAVALRPVPPKQGWPGGDDDGGVIVDLPPAKITPVRLTQPAIRRGRLPLARVELKTQFPLGLFTAWSYWRTPVTCLVYPRPQGALPLPEPRPEAINTDTGRQSGSEDFSGFRDYRPGDSPRHIAWKALAREQGLHVKRFSGGSAGHLRLSLAEVAHLEGLEAQLSQLTKWVIEADLRDVPYGLELPGADIPVNSGVPHRDCCLEALALHAWRS